MSNQLTTITELSLESYTCITEPRSFNKQLIDQLFVAVTADVVVQLLTDLFQDDEILSITATAAGNSAWKMLVSFKQGCDSSFTFTLDKTECPISETKLLRTLVLIFEDEVVLIQHIVDVISEVTPDQAHVVRMFNKNDEDFLLWVDGPDWVKLTTDNFSTVKHWYRRSVDDIVSELINDQYTQL